MDSHAISHFKELCQVPMFTLINWLLKGKPSLFPISKSGSRRFVNILDCDSDVVWSDQRMSIRDHCHTLHSAHCAAMIKVSTKKWIKNSKKVPIKTIKIQVKNRFPVKSVSASEIKCWLLFTGVRLFICNLNARHK